MQSATLLFSLTAILCVTSLPTRAQNIEMPRTTFVEGVTKRMVLDTLYDEVHSDYQSARRIIGGLRADLDTCSAIAQRSNDRFDAATFELDLCAEELKETTDKLKRRTVWAWIAKIGFGVGVALGVKQLVDTAQP